MDQYNLRDKTDIIIVSDHGMTEIDYDHQVIFLDDYVNSSLIPFEIYGHSPVSTIFLAEEYHELFYASLHNKHPNLTIYKHEDVPTHWHCSNHRRSGDFLLVADLGWSYIKKIIISLLYL